MITKLLALFAVAVSASAGTLNLGNISLAQGTEIVFTLDLDAPIPTSIQFTRLDLSPGTLPLNNPPVQVFGWWSPVIDSNDPTRGTITVPADATFGGTVGFASIVFFASGPDLVAWLAQNYGLQCDGICNIRYEFSQLSGELTQQLQIVNIADTQVPEPSTYAMVGVAALAIGWWRRRR